MIKIGQGVVHFGDHVFCPHIGDHATHTIENFAHDRRIAAKHQVNLPQQRSSLGKYRKLSSHKKNWRKHARQKLSASHADAVRRSLHLPASALRTGINIKVDVNLIPVHCEKELSGQAHGSPICSDPGRAQGFVPYQFQAVLKFDAVEPSAL